MGALRGSHDRQPTQPRPQHPTPCPSPRHRRPRARRRRQRHAFDALHMLPGLWTIDGYGKLVNGLKARFMLNEASADQPESPPLPLRLASVERPLGDKLAETDPENWIGGASTRRILTRSSCSSATPWAGWSHDGFWRCWAGVKSPASSSPSAHPTKAPSTHCVNCATGYRWDGSLDLKLTALVRSLPSLYQLLPTYPCLDPGDGVPKALTDARCLISKPIGCGQPPRSTARLPNRSRKAGVVTRSSLSKGTSSPPRSRPCFAPAASSQSTRTGASIGGEARCLDLIPSAGVGRRYTGRVRRPETRLPAEHRECVASTLRRAQRASGQMDGG